MIEYFSYISYIGYFDIVFCTFIYFVMFSNQYCICLTEWTYYRYVKYYIFLFKCIIIINCAGR